MLTFLKIFAQLQFLNQFCLVKNSPFTTKPGEREKSLIKQNKYITSKLKSLFLIIILIIGVSFSQTTTAQNINTDTLISLNYSGIKLKEVLKDITVKTNTHFSYNPGALPLDTLITYSCNKKKLAAALTEIFGEAGVAYQIIENHVVLKAAPLKSEIEAKQELKPKWHTINGYITDAKNQEALIGATIYNSATGVGTITNNYGFFSLTLPEGNYQIETSYVGYGVFSEKVLLHKNYKWNIALQPVASMVSEIIVTSNNRETYIFNVLAAQTNIKPFEVKKQTAVLGETDMLKSFDNLPGISFQGDGSSYFYVRGGNRDQNLILLDEAPIYNPSHMLGLFTPIIPDAVKSTNIYKADFPIQYGGRLSSLVDIRTRDGNMEQFSGSASLGLVATRVSVEGPLKKQASSYFVSYRRSYLGMFLKKIQPSIKDLYFSDFTSKFNIRLGAKNRVFLTLYNGKDVFLNQETQTIANGLKWGNTSFTARWNHVFGSRLFVNTTFYSSRYDYFLYTDYAQNLHWNSHISSTHLKSEFTWYLNPKSQINYGLKLGTYLFNPGNYNAPNLSEINTVSPNHSNEFIIYAGHGFQPSEKILLNYGLRFTSWANSGKAFVVNYKNYKPVDYVSYQEGEKYYQTKAIEPRLSLSLKTGKYASLKASYNRTLQNINLINNSISPFNTLEVWLPSGPNIKPQKADIYNLGYLQTWTNKNMELNVDVFYKKLYNQIGFSYHANTLLNPFLEGELRQGSGKAYGFELLLKKTKGKLTGQMGYAFTRSLLLIEGLNGNREYKARQDKPIDFSLALGYSLKPRWQLNFNYLYASGLMITTPTSFYYYLRTQVPVYSAQNNSRLPNYKRLDLGSDFRLNKLNGKFEHHLVVSIYNLLGNQNPAFLYFTKMVDENGGFKIPADKANMHNQVATQRYIFSVMPSITYNLKF